MKEEQAMRKSLRGMRGGAGSATPETLEAQHSCYDAEYVENQDKQCQNDSDRGEENCCSISQGVNATG